MGTLGAGHTADLDLEHLTERCGQILGRARSDTAGGLGDQRAVILLYTGLVLCSEPFIQKSFVNRTTTKARAASS